jgi:zona occludens toxin
MIILRTGTPGSGKSLATVAEIIKFVEAGRTVYTNIKGLKIDGVLPLLEAFKDYPVGSVVVIDECQQLPHFSRKFRGVHDDIEFLQTHRHEGLDIILVTQHPKFLNNDALVCVGEHYHMHRAMNAKMATVWLWRYFVENPNSRSNKNEAETEFLFTFPKRLFNYYESTKQDTHNKIRIPAKLLNAIWMLCLLLIGTGYIFTKYNLFGSPAQAQTEVEKLEQSAETQTVSNPLDNSSKPVSENSTIATAHEVNAVQTINYDPNRPFENQFNNAQVLNNQPYLSGCIQLKNKCSCYTQQGSKLDVSIADCKKVINEGMPFNPFLAQSQSTPAPVQSPAQAIPNV